ncbi:MAG: amino acid adenylation domain-containing protein, partial [Spirochaetales bacterium]|nr:amino acid adenylation domain-containing protein [Spirochaetales bacterium]
ENMDSSLKEKFNQFSAQLWEDLDHPGVSGIRVLRELKNKKMVPADVTIPIVFTSMISENNSKAENDTFADFISYTITQTPQVYLDHQVFMRNGTLVLAWDVIEDYFEPAVLTMMFADYCGLIKQVGARTGDPADVSVKELFSPVHEVLPPQPDEQEKYEEFQLTDQQQAYWFGRLTNDYTQPVACQFYQEFDAQNINSAKFNKALNTLINYHEMLRAVILSKGKQVISKTPGSFEIEVIDLREETENGKMERLKEIKKSMVEYVFPLDTWPMFDIKISLLDEVNARIHFSIDMMIADGKSIEIIINQLFSLYDNVSIPVPAFSFRDYVMYKNRFKEPGEKDVYTGYWEKKFENMAPAPDFLNITPGQPLEKINRGSYRYEFMHWNLLKKKAKELGVSPQVILLAAYGEVLLAWNRRESFSLVVPCWERTPVHQDINLVVGDFTTLCWVSFEKNDLSFVEKIRHYQKVLQDDIKHSRVSGLTVLRKKNDRDLSFPVVFTSLMSENGLKLPYPIKTGASLSQTPHVFLDNISRPDGDTIHLHWDGIENAFPQGMLESMFDGYCRLLNYLFTSGDWDRTDFQAVIKAHRGSFPRTTDNDMLMIDNWNNTYKQYPDSGCLHEYIEEKIREVPDSTAVVFCGQQIDYKTLNARSNQCALYLRKKGAGPDTIVAVMMERSFEMVISLLAILKAGAAYLPVDPHYPAERIQFLCDDAEVDILLTQQRFKDKAPGVENVICLDAEWNLMENKNVQNPTVITNPDNLAYVIYTSGSTGNPKGCMIPHKAICNRLFWMQDAYRIDTKDRVLQKTPYTFDVSVWEFFWPMLTGATMVVAEPEKHKDNRYLVDVIQREKITTCHFVPSMLNFFLNQEGAGNCTTLRHVFTSGEALSYHTTDRFLDLLDARLHNLYGPTEAAVDVTYWEADRREDKKVPIGRPISNIQIHILDKNLKPVPVNSPGELHIGGTGLARGYLNRKELTGQKFIPNPFKKNEKLYKTGDLACRLDDGNIEFLGRIDFQVKIRGLRIELEEIENRILKHPACKDVAVLVRDHDTIDPKIVAYWVPNPGEIPPVKELRKFVGSSLPDYMVPNIFVQLEKLPVTIHGKLDRKALPWPVKRSETNKQIKMELKMPADEKIDSIIDNIMEYLKEAVCIDEIDTEESLFDLGATSLTLVQIAQKLEKEEDIAVPIEVFLKEPTLHGLRKYLEKVFKDKNDTATDKGKPGSFEGKYQKSAIISSGTHYNKNGKIKNPVNDDTVFSSFSDKPISMKQISELLGLLRIHVENDKYNTLFVSSGGPVSTHFYLYVKKDKIEGLGEGVYKYDPFAHHLVFSGAVLQKNISFLSPGHPLFGEKCHFLLFLVADLSNWKLHYRQGYKILSLLDAGYISQTLMERTPPGLLLLPFIEADYRGLRSLMPLEANEKILYCLSGVFMNQNDHYHPVPVSGRLPRIYKSDIEISEMDFDNASIGFTHNIHHKHEFKNRQAEHDINNTIMLGNCEPHSLSSYKPEKRFTNNTIPREKIKQLFEGFKTSKNTAFTPHYIKLAHDGDFKLWVYVRKDKVKGFSPGMYHYNPREDSFIKLNINNLDLRYSYFPGNRKIVDQEAFHLFIIGDLEKLSSDYDGECLHYALIEAGRLGLHLLGKQTRLNIGLCPIGLINFHTLKQRLQLKQNEILLHNIAGGSVT